MSKLPSDVASRNAKKLWTSLSEIEKKKLLDATILSPDVRASSREARIAGLKRSWASLSPEARASRINKAKLGLQKAKLKKSESMRKYWATRTVSERKAHYHKSIGTISSKRKVAKSVKQIWDSYTLEERQARLNNSSHSEKARLGRIANWNRLSQDEKENWIRVHLRRRQWKMTGIESIVNDYLNHNFPNEWKYNGCRNCDMVIGGKIPDFININGKKSVIEVFGRYWHKENEVKSLKAHYAKFGFDCIVIWEDECNNLDRIFGNYKVKV